MAHHESGIFVLAQPSSLHIYEGYAYTYIIIRSHAYAVSILLSARSFAFNAPD
jgi:hypothetical protein